MLDQEPLREGGVGVQGLESNLLRLLQLLALAEVLLEELDHLLLHRQLARHGSHVGTQFILDESRKLT